MNRCSAPNRRGGRSSAVPSRCTTRCCDRSSTKLPNAKRSGSGCAGIGSCSEMIQKSANDSAGKPSHCDGPMSTCTTLRGSDMPPLRHLLAVTALTASVATAAPQGRRARQRTQQPARHRVRAERPAVRDRGWARRQRPLRAARRRPARLLRRDRRADPHRPPRHRSAGAGHRRIAFIGCRRWLRVDRSAQHLVLRHRQRPARDGASAPKPRPATGSVRRPPCSAARYRSTWPASGGRPPTSPRSRPPTTRCRAVPTAIRSAWSCCRDVQSSPMRARMRCSRSLRTARCGRSQLSRRARYRRRRSSGFRPAR